MARLCVFTNQWQSGEIRGRQIAGKLIERGHEVVVDPTEILPTDTLLSIKCILPDEVVKGASRVLVDTVDSGAMVAWLRRLVGVAKRPEAIAISTCAKDYLQKELPGVVVHLLKEHHCNWEGTRLAVKKPKVVGYCGTIEGIQLEAEQVAKAIGEVGYRLASLIGPTSREQVIGFYRQIDVQLCWRKDQPHPELKNPLKLANAGSFGVPTIAWPEVSYVAEWPTAFMPAKSLDDVVWHLDSLNKPSRYDYWSSVAYEASRDYEIERVISRYEQVIYG